MAFNPYTLYAVNIQTIDSVDLFIDQVSNQNISPNAQLLLLGADGGVDPTFVGVRDQQPTIDITTSALATVLASCGISGLKIDSDVDDDGAEFWFQKIVEGGTRDSDSNHYKMTVNEALLYPVTLRAPHNGVATLDLRFVITYDGTNEPIVIAASQALEGTPAVGEVFTAGPVMLNGSQLEGVQDITVDFGIVPIVLGSDGGLWPTFAAIQRREPTIRVRTADASHFSTYGLDGTAQGATDSIVYLRKMAEGATRVANGTAEHISFTIDEGIITVGPLGGGHNEMQVPEIIITPTYDGSNAIIVINTATAIT